MAAEFVGDLVVAVATDLVVVAVAVEDLDLGVDQGLVTPAAADLVAVEAADLVVAVEAAGSVAAEEAQIVAVAVGEEVLEVRRGGEDITKAPGILRVLVILVAAAAHKNQVDL